MDEHEAGQDIDHVMVAELPDAGDPGRFSGLFVATWQSADGEESIVGPVDVSLNDALAWARKRSDVVLIRVGNEGDQLYSAGVRTVTGHELRPWPTDQIVANRPVGSPLDGRQQTATWVVRVRLEVSRVAFRKIVNDVSSSGLLIDRRVPPDEPDASFSVTIEARGGGTAAREVARVVGRALGETDELPGPDEARMRVSFVGRAP